MSIQINERFEIRPDRYGWVLVEHIPKNMSHRNAKSDRGTTTEYHTYHASPEQCCRTILARTGGDCETAEGLVREWDRVHSEVCEAVRGIRREDVA